MLYKLCPNRSPNRSSYGQLPVIRIDKDVIRMQWWKCTVKSKPQNESVHNQ